MVSINGENNTLVNIICTGIFFIALMGSWVAYAVYATKAKFKYLAYIDDLKKSGKYIEWHRKHKILLFAGNFSMYGALFSFWIFLIVAVIDSSRKYQEYLIIPFAAFIILSFVSVLFFIVLFSLAHKKT
jgi:hypothetical protein